MLFNSKPLLLLKHSKKLIMRNSLYFIVGLALIISAACQPNAAPKHSHYVLTTQFETSNEEHTTAAVLIPDTVQVMDPLQAYSMGVQRYAAGLLYVHQHLPKNAVQLQGIQIKKEDGTPIQELTTQAQRDSILMDFLKFARKSSIPYYEHVKLFESDIMSIR
jgi:hypothetical protein